MTNKLKYLVGIFALLIIFSSCKKKEYSLGDLTAPSNIVISAEPVGKTAALPNGDGSGDVNFTITADNALSYKIDFDANDAFDLKYLPTGTATKKYTTLGVNTYKVTAVVYGKGGTSSTVTKDVTVKSDFTPSAQIVTDLTNNASKTWGVNKDVAGHFGVGPWSPTCYTGCWWSAAVNEKVSCCNCFYTARFTFTKNAAPNSYTLTVSTPDGVFTKTGALAGGLPGIPASGGEGCYPYAGGSNSFSFGPSTSGLVTSATNVSTNTSINLAGNNTFIGYGSLGKEFEILKVTPTELRLRAQGTETGNSWNLVLKAY
ncbi:MAG: hypothetical protein ABL929_06995 [Ferruginibacter sp.]|nr:hypothetical protein [Ferruginibacter sp.]